MPTDEQLRTYAESLPPIYRTILSAFPQIEPTRKQGYGLAFQTLAAEFASGGMGISLSEVMQACQELAQQNLVEIKHRIFVHPTPLGERLIAIVTGKSSPTVEIPPLPALP